MNQLSTEKNSFMLNLPTREDYFFFFWSKYFWKIVWLLLSSSGLNLVKQFWLDFFLFQKNVEEWWRHFRLKTGNNKNNYFSLNKKCARPLTQIPVSPNSLTKNFMTFGPELDIKLVFANQQLFACEFHWLLQLATKSVKLAWSWYEFSWWSDRRPKCDQAS